MKRIAETHFMPGRLQTKLRSVPSFGATMIAGPSGYGKTTAIRWLEETDPEAEFLWCETAWRDAESGWKSFCKLVARFDNQSAEALLPLKITSGDEIQAAHMLRRLKCSTQRRVYLIVDDVQRLAGMVPAILITGLMSHSCPQLRVIVAGTGFELLNSANHVMRGTLWINREDLEFLQDDIVENFRAAGVELTVQQAQAIYLETGGWPVAVAAHLQSVLFDGGTEGVRMDELLGRMLFDRLTKAQQERLLAISFYEEYAEADLCDLWGIDSLQLDDYTLLSMVPLLMIDQGAGICRSPLPLRQFLQERLKHAPDDVFHRVNMAAGNRCAARGNTARAVGRYYAAKNYEAILSLDLKLLSHTMIDGTPFCDIAREIIREAPMELKQAHPISLLRLAYHLFGCGDRVGYSVAMAQAKIFMTPEQSPQLYGEWLLVSMLAHMPDIAKMHDVLRQAKKYLTVPCRSIPAEEPFLFGCPSFGFVFYDVPGEGELVGQRLEAWLKDMRQLQGGLCGGAVHLYRGELRSMQLRLPEALTLAHTASSLAEQESQLSMMFGVSLLMARIAIVKGDHDGLKSALHMLDEQKRQFSPSAGADMFQFIYTAVRSLIVSLAVMRGMEPAQNDPPSAPPRGDSVLAQMSLHVRVVEKLKSGELYGAIGEMEAILSRGREAGTVTLLATHGALGVAHTLMGNRQLAVDNFIQAFELAKPDGLIGFLINYVDELRELQQEPAMKPWLPFLRKILAHSAAMREERRLQTHPMQQTRYESILTSREMEVAQLAAKGLRNAEIAKQLHVTENTVKKHMQFIFAKLGIDRRSNLADKFNNP